MANNPSEFPKKESPLIRWYLSQVPGATILPSGAVRLQYTPPEPSPEPEPEPGPGPGPGPEPGPGPNPDPCEGVVCSVGYICQNGECVPDPNYNPPGNKDLLFNKTNVVSKVAEAAQENNLGSKYATAVGKAVDRWNAIASYPEALIDVLPQLPEQLRGGIHIHPEDINWGNNLDLIQGVQPAVVFIDKPDSSVIAACSPITAYNTFGTRKGQVCASFTLIINTPQATTFDDEALASILVHELGHALGINGIWTAQADSGTFVDSDQCVNSGYPQALAGFNSIQTTNQTRIPLESTGEQGTAGSHWENGTRLGIPAIINEMMTGFAFSDGSYPKITALTTGTLADYGYKIKSTESGGILSTFRSTHPAGVEAVKLECHHLHIEPEIIDLP